MTYCEPLSPTRRTMLLSSGAFIASAYLPKFARAADGRDPRLIVIILRGAMDGLSAVAPAGDPDYAALHGDLALPANGPNAGIALDSFFLLNPAMTTFARLYKAGQAAVIHATATPYRERSHFDGQDVLESGFAGPGQTSSGWLNRAISSLPQGDHVGRISGLAVGATAPLVMRGAAPTLGWAPQFMPVAGEDLAMRVMDLYRHTDPALAQALMNGLDTEKRASRDGMSGEAAKSKGGMDSAAGMRQAAQGAAKLMVAEDGPRIAAMAFEGWDTHQNEGGASGRLFQLLGGLDGAFEEFEKGLGSKWQNTAIVVMTEFGRTAKINGTIGTDHGTGTVAFLVGGAIKGGRVIADWPGLKTAQLFEERDLKPTTDLRSVLKGILADHFGLSAAALSDKVFPDSAAVKPLQGLIGV